MGRGGVAALPSQPNLQMYVAESMLGAQVCGWGLVTQGESAPFRGAGTAGEHDAAVVQLIWREVSTHGLCNDLLSWAYQRATSVVSDFWLQNPCFVAATCCTEHHPAKLFGMMLPFERLLVVPGG